MWMKQHFKVFLMDNRRELCTLQKGVFAFDIQILTVKVKLVSFNSHSTHSLSPTLVFQFAFL